MKTRRLIPMLFSTPMVQGIGKRIKTQTRRVVKSIHPEAEFRADLNVVGYTFVEPDGKLQTPEMASVVQCPYGKPGDIIWVRETWCEMPNGDYAFKASTDADSEDLRQEYLKSGAKWAKWKPNMHMPLRACRNFLEVKSVRVERLQDITEEDARHEGVETKPYGSHPFFCTRDYLRPKRRDGFWSGYCADTGKQFRRSFQSLWQSINGRESWDANPWVWVVEFEVIGVNEMMQFCDEILASYDKKRRGKVHSDLLECIVRLSEKKEATV